MCDWWMGGQKKRRGVMQISFRYRCGENEENNENHRLDAGPRAKGRS